MSDSLVNAGPRTIGESGFEVGPLAYGCWRFTTDSIDDVTILITKGNARIV